MDLRLLGQFSRSVHCSRRFITQNASLARLTDSLACAHYPEESSGSLEVSGIVTCCQFNRWGSLLACGCNDGRVAIFDFITRQAAKVLHAHAQPIACLACVALRNMHGVCCALLINIEAGLAMVAVWRPRRAITRCLCPMCCLVKCVRGYDFPP